MATITASPSGGTRAYSDPLTWVGGVVPTLLDDARLDATSGAVTIDGTTGSPNLGRSFDCTGYTGTLTHGATGVLNIVTNLKLVASMVYVPTAGAIINFVGGIVTGTIETGGKSLPIVNFNAPASNYSQVAGVIMRTLNLVLGGYATNNQTLWCTNGMNLAGTGVRSMNFGSSVISMQGTLDLSDMTNLTLNAGTSQIQDGSITGWTLSGSNIALYNVGGMVNMIGTNNVFNDVATSRHSGGGRGTLTVYGDFTCHDFAGSGYQAVSQSNRMWIRSNDNTQRRTITCNGAVSINKCDFDGIIGAGSASWDMTNPTICTNFAGTTGNNSGIIFEPGANLYWVHDATASRSFSDARWFTSSGGAIAANRFPLLQDTANFDVNSFPTAGKTVVYAGDMPSLVFSGLTNSPVLNRTAVTNLYGDLIADNTFTLGGNSDLVMRGYGARTITVPNTPTGTPALFTASKAATYTISGTPNWAGTISVSMGQVAVLGNMNITGQFNATGGVLTATGMITASSSVNVTLGGNMNAYGITATGNFVCAQGTAVIGAGGFSGGGQFNLTNAASIVTVNGPFSSAGNITHGIGALSLYSNASCLAYSASSSNARSLYLAPGVTLNCTGTGTVFNIAVSTGMNLSAAGATVQVSNTSVSSKTFAGGGLTTLPRLHVNGASGAGVCDISGNNTFEAISGDPGANIRLPTGGTTTILKPLELMGAPGLLLAFRSISSTLTTTVICPNGLVNCDYVNIARIVAGGNVPFYAGANSTNGGTNTNWLFQAPVGLGKCWDAAAGVLKDKQGYRWNGTSWQRIVANYYNGATFVPT